MSLPELPDVFGNYALVEFVEVASPKAIDWWPQTVGWWWLGAILGLWLLYVAWKAAKRWYRDRYRREAADRLRRLKGATNSPSLVADLNRLLKLTAMAAYSRAAVARLSGADWVEFLNSQCPAPPFSEEQGRLLASAGYTGIALARGTGEDLLAAGMVWVQQHQRQGNG
ncbi:MAG: DUF4381 domain-containing protein [Pseudomonadota bacterium]